MFQNGLQESLSISTRKEKGDAIEQALLNQQKNKFQCNQTFVKSFRMIWRDGDLISEQTGGRVRLVPTLVFNWPAIQQVVGNHQRSSR